MQTFDKQKAFTTALEGVRQQRKPSMDTAAGSCMYRSYDGAKCGVGHLIPDDQYRQLMEFGSIRQRKDLIFPVIGATEDDLDFLVSLQRAHDSAAVTHNNLKPFLTRFNDKMKIVADLYDLEYTDVQ